MLLTQEDLARLAEFSQLELATVGTDTTLAHLQQLIDVVDTLSTIDTGDTQPLLHLFDPSQPLREDVVTEQDCREDVMHLAANTADHHYVVPQVIEE
ncbi:MAG TPA: Asp-tRNA(Asn)/Glu-tRNA(Gln) amidotransferase subunit GatC [Alcanivoracaceae bacterium]|nr:Asp-tRNA(Asn)/Glu-tRNA(Gln) amidotransferase subunit GatC [Alcanivoracaceae bacterium]